MAITRDEVVAAVVPVVQAYLVEASMSIGPTEATNPISTLWVDKALRQMGLATTAIASVSTPSLEGQLIELATLAALRSVRGNLTLVDFSIGGRSESLSQLSTQLDTWIQNLEASIAAQYGTDVAELVVTPLSPTTHYGGTESLDNQAEFSR